MNEFLENNTVSLIGEIVSDFKNSHEVFGKKFYLADLKVQRTSDACDVIPIMVSDRLFAIEGSCVGCCVEIKGQFRSYNRHGEAKTKLLLSVFVLEINFVDAIVVSHDSNLINLEGFICKAPVYRQTPLGREITDILLAVNRSYGKSDYIPCICWGRNARYVKDLQVGEKLKITGRIQSRIYMKKIDEEHSEERTAYEVSISRLEVIKDEN